LRKPIALKSEYILPVHELFAQSPARVQKIKGAAHEIVVKNRTSSTETLGHAPRAPLATREIFVFRHEDEVIIQTLPNKDRARRMGA
jgi:hypothetical protein